MLALNDIPGPWLYACTFRVGTLLKWFIGQPERGREAEKTQQPTRRGRRCSSLVTCIRVERSVIRQVCNWVCLLGCGQRAAVDPACLVVCVVLSRVRFETFRSGRPPVAVSYQEGEVCVSGPNVMQGYNNLPDASAEVFFDFDGKRCAKRRKKEKKEKRGKKHGTTISVPTAGGGSKQLTPRSASWARHYLVRI